MTDTQPPETLTARLRRITAPLVYGVAGVLSQIGISADALTVGGMLLAGVGAYFAARGMFGWAALLLALGAPLDALDGAVARTQNAVRPFGALLDSTLDRYGEFFFLTGLGYYFAMHNNLLGMVLAFVALFGSVMVSYVRARSEGLRVDNKVGLLTRVERMMLLMLSLLAGWLVGDLPLLIGVGVIALGAHVTVIQRMVEANRLLREQDTSKE